MSIQLQRLLRDCNFECPILYDHNYSSFVHFRCKQHYPTISVQYHQQHHLLEERLKRIHNQVDDIQLLHHHNPNHHRRWFPIVHRRIFLYDQLQFHLMALATVGVLLKNANYDSFRMAPEPCTITSTLMSSYSSHDEISRHLTELTIYFH